MFRKFKRVFLENSGAWLRTHNMDASKNIFVVTDILLFDFELFIGALYQKETATIDRTSSWKITY